jgi:hypothetical protein
MDYFGGGKRLGRSLHRRVVDGYMRSGFLTSWDVRAIGFYVSIINEFGTYKFAINSSGAIFACLRTPLRVPFLTRGGVAQRKQFLRLGEVF